MSIHYLDVRVGDSVVITAVAAEPEPKKTLLGTLEGVPIYCVEDRVEWTADMAIDADGSPGNPYNDPYWQPETSLSHNGKPIDAEKVPYVVVPPLIRNGVKPVVMGCQAHVVNTKNGKITDAVVADQGPSSKIGEASCECARRVGLDGNPNHGGTDQNIIAYTIWPGIPAEVDGVHYKLQPS